MHQFAIRLRFNTPPHDRNTLPKVIFDHLPHQPGLETREFKPPSGALGRIRKDHRTGLIRVDWVDMSSYQEKQKFAKDTSRGVSNRLALIVALTLTQDLRLLASKELHQNPLLVQWLWRKASFTSIEQVGPVELQSQSRMEQYLRYLQYHLGWPLRISLPSSLAPPIRLYTFASFGEPSIATADPVV